MDCEGWVVEGSEGYGVWRERERERERGPQVCFSLDCGFILNWDAEHGISAKENHEECGRKWLAQRSLGFFPLDEFFSLDELQSFGDKQKQTIICLYFIRQLILFIGPREKAWIKLGCIDA